MHYLLFSCVRWTPNKKTGLLPHEVLMGRAMIVSYIPSASLVAMTDFVLGYCKGLADVVKSLSHEVNSATESTKEIMCHLLQPGDWVYIKKHVRKNCLEPRWKLVTNTAVKWAGIPQWIHAAHTKKVKPVEEEVVDTTTNSPVPNSLSTEQVCSVDPKGGEEEESSERAEEKNSETP